MSTEQIPPPASSSTVPAVGKHPAAVGRTEAGVSAWQPGMRGQHDSAAGGAPAAAGAAAGDAAVVAAAMLAMGRQTGLGLMRATARAPAQACRWAVGAWWERLGIRAWQTCGLVEPDAQACRGCFIVCWPTSTKYLKAWGAPWLILHAFL